METLNKKAGSLEIMGFGERGIDDRGLNTSDSLSLVYEPHTTENIFLEIFDISMSIYRLFMGD